MTYKYKGVPIVEYKHVIAFSEFESLEELDSLVAGMNPIVMTKGALKKYKQLVGAAYVPAN